MEDINIMNKITQGMYILTTNSGGCVVDAVSQISFGEKPLISVAVIKKNYTNQLLRENSKFALSVLGKNVNPGIIKTFGFNSMKNINKFENIETTTVDEINIINDSLGYMLCEIVDYIDNDTHTLFIGKVIKSKVFKDEEPMSYGYYQQHKDELLKVTTNSGKTAWICSICGYICYYDELPGDYKCPICGVDKNLFKKN